MIQIKIQKQCQSSIIHIRTTIIVFLEVITDVIIARLWGVTLPWPCQIIVLLLHQLYCMIACVIIIIRLVWLLYILTHCLQEPSQLCTDVISQSLVLGHKFISHITVALHVCKKIKNKIKDVGQCWFYISSFLLCEHSGTNVWEQIGGTFAEGHDKLYGGSKLLRWRHFMESQSEGIYGYKGMTTRYMYV